MESVTTTALSVPVVGVPAYAGKSHHEGEILRCPTEQKLYELSSSGSQNISYEPSIKRCENFRRPSKKSAILLRCDQRADTLIHHSATSFKVCDLCFCANKWIILFLLFSMLPSVSAAEISVNFGSLDLGCLMVFILLLSFLCLHYLSTMYSKTVATIEKFMEENTRRHLWRLGTDIVLSFIRPGQPAFQLQGYATDCMQLFTKFLKVLAGAAAVFCLCAGHEYDWYKRLVSFTKNSSAVIYATKSLENFFSGNFSFPLSKNEKSDELVEAMEMSWISGTRFTPMVSLLKKGARFDEKLLTEYFMVLKPKQIKAEIGQMLIATSAKSYLVAMRERAESCEALLLVLTKNYGLTAEEIDRPEGNQDRAGLGLAPPAEDLPWLDSSYLMKAAIRADFFSKMDPMGDEAAQARMESLAEARCELKWKECFGRWKDHCRVCPHATHNFCDLGLNSMLATEVQAKFGYLAWPESFSPPKEEVVTVTTPDCVSREPAIAPVVMKDPVPFVVDLEPLCLPVTDIKLGEDVAIIVPEPSPSIRVPGTNYDMVVHPVSVLPKDVGKEPEDTSENLDLSSICPASDVDPTGPLACGVLTALGTAAAVPPGADLTPERLLPKSLPDMVIQLCDGAMKSVSTGKSTPAKVTFVKATVQSSFATIRDTVVHTARINYLRAKGMLRERYDAAADACQFYVTLACLKMGYLTTSNKIDKVNISMSTSKLSPTIQDAMAEEEIDSPVLVAHNNFAGKVLLDSPHRLLNGVITISSILLVLALGCAASYARQRNNGFKYNYVPKVSRDGYVGASGAKDIDREVNEWEDSIARGEKVKGRLSRFEEIASSYHDKRNQGFVPGVQLGQLLVNAVLEKYIPRKVTAPVSCDPMARASIAKAQRVNKCPQGRLLPDNVGVAMSRTFGAFSDPGCGKETYLLNAFLVGRYLFSELHNLPEQFWIRSLAGQVYEMHLKNFRLAPGHKDLVYTLWSAPLSFKKISLAVPEVLQPVVLVSSRGTDYTVKDGIVIGVGEDHGWATYNSIAGDCAGPVLNAQGLVVGFHQLGTDVFANGFLKVDQALIDLVKQNGEPPLVSAVLQANSLVFDYKREDSLPAGNCVRNKYFSGHFLAFAKTINEPTGLQEYCLPSFAPGKLEEGLKKFDHPEPNPDHYILTAVFSDLMVELSKFVGVSSRSTIEQVHAAADQTSGPGFPYCRTYQTKAALFSQKPSLWRTFAERPDEVIWYAKLKCEVREIGKLARTYLACPVSFAYYANQFFLDFNNRFYAAGAKMNGFFSTVAMVPQYGGWQRLKDSLFLRGFSFDGKKFDTRVHSTLLWYCCYARILKFDSSEIPSFVWCYEHFINSKIFTPEGYSCVKSKGMPSGGVNTIVDNTMALYMMINYAFRRVSKLPFSQHVKLALNGDDSLITMSEEALKTFDARAFANVLSEDFGMTFSTESWEPRPVSELDYLSRFFHTSINGVIVPWFPFTKMRASLSFSAHPASYGYSLCRAHGILAEMWTNCYARHVLTEYIRWLKTIADEHDPWTQLANKMELPEWQLSFMATGIAPPIFADEKSVTESLKYYLPGELQSATPGKGVFIKPLQMEPTIKINLAPGGKQKKVPVKPNQRKNQKEKKNKRKVVEYKQPRVPRNLVPSARGQVADILRSLIVPGEGTEHRFSLKYGSRPTALASVRYKLNAAFGNLKTSSTSAFLFRSALRAAMVSFVPVAGIAAYSAVDTKVTLANGTVTPYFFHLPLSNVPGSTIKAVHGPVLYPGKSESLGPQYGYYCNAGDILRPVITAWGTVTALVCSVFRYEPTGWIMLSQQTLTPMGSSYDFDIVVPGYYAVKFGEPGGVGPNLPVTVTCALTIDCCANPTFTTVNLGQLSLPQLAEQFPLVGSMRVQSASLMFTQTTPMINRGGKLGMAQIDRNTDYDQFLTYDSIASINTKIATTLDATNGGYCFLKPTDTKDLELISEFETDADLSGGDAFVQFSGGLRDAFFQITPDKGYLTTNVLLPGPISDTIPDTRDGYWTMHWNVEYETIDQWRSLAEGRNMAKEIDDAIAFLSLAPQFHSNAFHIDELMQWMRSRVKNTAAFVTEHGPELLNIVSSVVKAAGVIGALV